MAAAAARKLQKEIEMTLKKVDDGIIEFDTVWDDANSSSNQSNKEKLGEELKKAINKLQRFRVQIREWIGMSEVKNKDKLESARKRIEFNMQRFKEFERELKTKAYSTFALAKDEEEDLDTQEKRDAEDWLRKQLDGLNEGIEMFEADIESVLSKKNPSAREKDEAEEKRRFKERHEWHIGKLECLLRACDNDTLDLSELAVIKESVEYYLECGTEADYYHDEALYDNFDIDAYAAEQEVAQSKKALLADKDSEVAEKCMLGGSDKKAKAKKAAAAKKVSHNPAAQKNLGKDLEKKKRVIGEDGEQKISEDQLVQEAEEFICKICYVHVVGCSPKLTKCSHLFCGDCLGQWFDQHPEIQTWAQRAKTAGDVLAHKVPCPVCKTPLNDPLDLYPIGPAATQSEHVLLWRMLSSLKVMCANHPKVEKGKTCEWIGEYQHYQTHIQNCKGETQPICMPAPPANTKQVVKSPEPKPVANSKNSSTAKQPSAPPAPTPAIEPPAPAPTPATEPPASGPPPGIQPTAPTPAAPATSSAPTKSTKAATTKTKNKQPPAPAAAAPVVVPALPTPAPTEAAPKELHLPITSTNGTSTNDLPQKPAQVPKPVQHQPPAPPAISQHQQTNVTVNVTVVNSNGQSTTQQVHTTTHQEQRTTQPAPAPSDTKGGGNRGTRDTAEKGIATSRFEPRGENTIDIEVGQSLQIIEEHTTGWTYVRNEATGISGWVPAWVVQRVPPVPEPSKHPHMPALAPFDRSSENELSVQKVYKYLYFSIALFIPPTSPRLLSCFSSYILRFAWMHLQAQETEQTRFGIFQHRNLPINLTGRMDRSSRAARNWLDFRAHQAERQILGGGVVSRLGHPKQGAITLCRGSCWR
ncbi:unnamed protein product [Amoebophrya sp. A120]|nr:unnamed protein product [Amoebophrya sp. A120]|eukprot:GSA120T00005010001.1